MTVKITDEAARRLLDQARQAGEKSYSPYSKFPVGAALLADDGRVFTGCNVENVNLMSGVCAERTAFVKAVSEGARNFQAIAVVCLKLQGGWPCGICRQFMREFGADLQVIVEGEDGGLQTLTISQLLPA